MEETVLKVADYSNEEKNRLMKKLHFFSWLGVITFAIFIVMDMMGLADNGGIAENVASFCQGLSFGILIIAVLYTSRYIYKFRAFKKRAFQHK